MDIISNNYLPGDQRLIEQIVRELKSQGIFDQFRKECISDVDTKPAYQNLRQRVESSVSGFLTKQTWNPEMNKNQVREMLRKNIYESGFLETGVERIVDQVVNPKITTVFLTKVEDVVYKFLGLEKPVKVEADVADPIKVNSFHDLLPTDLEAVSPEMPEEKDVEIKDYTEDVKMEELSPRYEMLNEKKEKFVQEENSVDSSQSSVLSGIISNDSNPSLKQDSLMSLNSSESRLSLVISENTPKIDVDDVFVAQKLSHSISKADLQTDEKTDVETVTEDAKKEFREILDSADEVTNENDATMEKTSEDINSKLKDSINKKRERHHSSSERSKSKSDRDKTKSDKYKKEERENSKERKIEKEKYRIPKLSDKNKTDKVSKSKDKDTKIKEKPDKDKNKKSDKDKRSVKHSSKSDNKSRKESKSDRKDKEKDDRREKKDSSKNEKTKDERKSSSSSYSSKQKESSSSKERNREKDKEIKKTSDETPEKSKNGHSSSSSSTTKKDSSTSKYKRDEDKSRSSKRKDDKDDRKKKRSSKDDHYSSKEKKNGRRSSDRDSDGPPDNKILPITPQKNSLKYSQAPKQDSFHSNSENSTDDTGNKDKIEDGNEEENSDTVQLEMQKIKLPKFASNLQEAMKIMKIRKQLKKLENTSKFNSENLEVKKLLNDIAELSKDGKKDKREEIMDSEIIVETAKAETNEDCTKTLTLDINDFISSSNISMAKWNALEAKFMEEMGCIDYDSYESPYLDEEESTSSDKNTNFEKIEKVLDKVKNKEPENIEQNTQEISCDNESVGQIEQTYLPEDKDQLNNEFEETIENIEKTIEVYKNEMVQFDEKIHNNEEPIGDEEKTSNLIHATLDSEENNQLNSMEIVSIEPDLVSNSVEFEENETTNELSSNISKSSNLPHTEADEKAMNYLKKSTRLENCRRKAVVLLEKHSLTEELIKSKRHGKHDNQDSLSDNLNKEKSLETEKENIELNKIIIVDKSTIAETHSSSGNEVKSIRNIEKNCIINQDAIDKIKNSVEERICENNDEILSRTCNQNFTGNRPSEKVNHLKCANKKIFDNRYQNSVDVDKTLLGGTCKKDNEEDNCLGFEASDDGRILTILKCLIKSLEDNVCESIENIKQLKNAKEHEIAQHPKNVEAKDDHSDISNNNLENAGYKRKGTHSPLNSLVPKKLRTTEENAEKITDIALENKFSLPLSPAESESEKREDHIVGTKSRRSKVTNNRVEKASSTAKKVKSPPKNSNGKKSARQRYSSEDLYKPRIFLRRTRNGTNNP